MLTFTSTSGAFTSVVYANFGFNTGNCNTGFTPGSCTFVNTTSVIAALCVGKTSCVIDASYTGMGNDPCYGYGKTLAVILSTTTTQILGAPGASCATACGAWGAVCNPAITTGNSVQAITSVMPLTSSCAPNASLWSAPWQPAYISDVTSPYFGQCQGW